MPFTALTNRRRLLLFCGVLLTALISSGVSSGLVTRAQASIAVPTSGVSTAAVTAATATTAATPAPTATPTTVTIPVPVIQQLMVLDCETAALQQGLGYYGINVSQAELFALENADTRLPVVSANHTVLQWGDPYTNFVGYVNGSDWTPTGIGVSRSILTGGRNLLKDG
ncbi:MAG: hypothetical protein ABI401_13390 [Candidatus Dormibacter sp.]